MPKSKKPEYQPEKEEKRDKYSQYKICSLLKLKRGQVEQGIANELRSIRKGRV